MHVTENRFASHGGKSIKLSRTLFTVIIVVSMPEMKMMTPPTERTRVETSVSDDNRVASCHNQSVGAACGGCLKKGYKML